MGDIVVVRHGHYNPGDGYLTDEGRAAITRLTALISQELQRTKALGDPSFFISGELRSHQTAMRMKNILSVFGHFISMPILASEMSGIAETEPAYVKLQGYRQTAILVGHHDFCTLFPAFFALREWGQELPLEGLDYAEAWFIDREARRITRYK